MDHPVPSKKRVSKKRSKPNRNRVNNLNQPNISNHAASSKKRIRTSTTPSTGAAAAAASSFRHLARQRKDAEHINDSDDEDDDVQVISVVHSTGVSRPTESRATHLSMEEEEHRSDLLREVFDTLKQNIPERYAIFNFHEFMEIAAEEGVDVERVTRHHNRNSNHSNHFFREQDRYGGANYEAAAAAAGPAAAAAAAPAGPRRYRLTPWTDMRMIDACHLVNDAIHEAVQQIHDKLTEAVDALRGHQLSLTTDDVVALLQLSGRSFVSRQDRKRALNVRALLALVQEEQSAFNQILNMKLRFAKRLIVKKGDPFYDAIVNDRPWQTRWTLEQASSVCRLKDVVFEKRDIDGKECVILYHGSPMENLKSFDANGIKFSGKGKLGNGFYLTASPNEAKSYACVRSHQHEKRGLVLEMAITNPDKFLVQFSPDWPSQTDTRGQLHVYRDKDRPNQFIFLDTALFKENVQILKCYLLDPGFQTAGSGNADRHDQFRQCR